MDRPEASPEEVPTPSELPQDLQGADGPSVITAQISPEQSLPRETPATSLMLIHALSAIHPGAGESNQGIQYPILRDGSGWPMIAASGLKGALRKQIRDSLYETYRSQAGSESSPETWKAKANQDPLVVSLFGTRETPFEGLQFNSAILLFYPLRAMQGPWAWVSSPALLIPYLTALGKVELTEEFQHLRGIECLCHPESPFQIEEKRIIIEEFELKQLGHFRVLGEVISRSLKGLGLGDLPQRLVVVSDEQMQFIVRYQTRIELYHKVSGRPQSVEVLPPESIFYTSLPLDSDPLVSQLSAALGDFITLGSHITSGLGLCQVALAAPQEDPQAILVGESHHG